MPPLSTYRKRPLTMKVRATPAALLLAAAVMTSCDRHKAPVETEKETPAHDEAPEPGAFILAKLDSIIIPVIDFEDTSLEEAMDYLRVRSIELDSYEPIDMRGVSILIKANPAVPNSLSLGESEPFTRIDRLHATNITLTEALIQTCEAAEVDAYLTSVAIVVCPKGIPPFPNPKADSGEVYKKLTQ